MGPVGIVVGWLGLVPVLESFEVSARMEDCASASFAFACPSCSVRSVIFVPCLLPWCDPIALQWQGLPVTRIEDLIESTGFFTIDCRE